MNNSGSQLYGHGMSTYMYGDAMNIYVQGRLKYSRPYWPIHSILQLIYCYKLLFKKANHTSLMVDLKVREFRIISTSMLLPGVRNLISIPDCFFHFLWWQKKDSRHLPAVQWFLRILYFVDGNLSRIFMTLFSRFTGIPPLECMLTMENLLDRQKVTVTSLKLMFL